MLACLASAQAATARLMESMRNLLRVVMLGWLCSGCLLRLEHNTTSPGARGVVLDARTRSPVNGAEAVVSRSTRVHPIVSEALTNARPPVVMTDKQGRFHIRAEKEWRLFVDYLVCRVRHSPGGTLLVRRVGYQPTTIQLWGEGYIPGWARPTNFIEVLLIPEMN